METKTKLPDNGRKFTTSPGIIPVLERQQHPKEILFNFFAIYRTHGLLTNFYEDDNFYTVEILHADEPTQWKIMEELVALPKPRRIHVHTSARTNRMEVFIEKYEPYYSLK